MSVAVHQGVPVSQRRPSEASNLDGKADTAVTIDAIHFVLYITLYKTPRTGGEDRQQVQKTQAHERTRRREISGLPPSHRRVAEKVRQFWPWRGAHAHTSKYAGRSRCN